MSKNKYINRYGQHQIDNSDIKEVVKVLKGTTLILFLFNFKSLKSDFLIIDSLSSAEY